MIFALSHGKTQLREPLHFFAFALVLTGLIVLVVNIIEPFSPCQAFLRVFMRRVLLNPHHHLACWYYYYLHFADEETQAQRD